MTWRAPVLEVIARSVADAIEAERGGAGRLEIISDFERGGLTPPLDLVREILAAVSLPVRVMLRESDGYEVSSPAGMKKLCASARELSRLPIEGVVLGFLRDKKIDLDATRRLLDWLSDKRATLHHAFDEVEDSFETIEKLKVLTQVDRVLTSGGSGAISEKIERMKRYAQAAQPEIIVLAGGGMNVESIRAIRRATYVREFHVGRAARLPASSAGAVQAALVRELVLAMKIERERKFGGDNDQ